MESKLEVLFLEQLQGGNWIEKDCSPLEALLNQAVLRRELMVHFQPQYEVGGGRGFGVEALARWTLPDGEEISPTIFIPLAERAALIRPLGAWVLERACETVAGWGGRGAEFPTLSVNVSTHQITEAFCSVLEGIIKVTGFPGERLELEITESALIVDTALTIECFEHWRSLGVRIAVDDFGTGYSSLNYLSRLPVDRLKIDRSFVNRMTCERKTAAIVRSVLALGEDLGITVLAEGIETERQFTMLQDLGCRQAQGFLFAKPLPPTEARALLLLPWGTRLAPVFGSGCATDRGLYAA